MGCDIHLFVEKRTKRGWQNRQGCRWHETPEHHERLVEVFQKQGRDIATLAPPSTKPCFDPGRNYLLFSILAGVRGDGIPIAPPRGLPNDVSARVFREAERYGPDGHSHSWLTLAELQAYDWAAPLHNRGIVGVDEYIEYCDTGAPSTWVIGHHRDLISNAEMDAYLISRCPGADVRSLYTAISWTVPYETYCAPFVQRIMPELAKLGAPSDVRIVFWFAN